MQLTGKVAVVTGGGSGLGRVLAATLAGAGASVAITGRHLAPLEAVAGELRRQGGTVLPLACDVRSMQQVEATVAAVERWQGSVDILVNNAAIFPPGLAALVDEEEWVSVIDTNVNGAFRMARTCLPGMIGKRWGRVINVVSPSGEIGMATVPAYGTSKGALMAFTRHLAAEVGRFGITVNGLCPGVVATEKFVDTFTGDVPAAAGAAMAIGRANTLEDFAGPLLLLASPASAGMTGSTLYVDGGITHCAPLPPPHVALIEQALGSTS
ncbi:MAG: 3-oxoacyl-[acyl-carrier-protein] reductase FabG [Pseudomonadales bacterium]|nr:3-oxoacyl-[acyl-carrier-protein] reductase FabG [Pseudomonadales bacterium]